MFSARGGEGGSPLFRDPSIPLQVIIPLKARLQRNYGANHRNGRERRTKFSLNPPGQLLLRHPPPSSHVDFFGEQSEDHSPRRWVEERNQGKGERSKKIGGASIVPFVCLRRKIIPDRRSFDLSSSSRIANSRRVPSKGVRTPPEGMDRNLTTPSLACAASS